MGVSGPSLLIESTDSMIIITSDMQNMVWGEPERVQNRIGI